MKQQRNEPLVPSETVAVTLLVRGEMCGFAKVDGGRIKGVTVRFKAVMILVVIRAHRSGKMLSLPRDR